jgi:flagellar hook-associated protein 3 FlgL
MAINSMSSSSTLLGQSVQNIKNQLNSLQVQLASGEKATTYSGMGVGEGFAVAARAQLANITGYLNTITNVTTSVTAANTALQGMDSIVTAIQTAATSGGQTLNNNGQTTAQSTAASQFGSMVDLLNTQAGNGYLFSGNAINTAPVASADLILNGNGLQAGLTQMIAERQQADLGTATPPTGRLVITAPTASAPTTVSVAEDSATSPFGLKLSSVSVSPSLTATGATVNGPSGSPPAISIALGATNPNPGDMISFTFNLPDGTSTTMQLKATTTTPVPAGSFAIGATPAATASNLNTALNSSISTVANTTLVAASAMAAGDDFFGSTSSIVGSVQNNQTAPVPITGTTLLSGVAGGGFASGDTMSVNGQTIQFYDSSATPPTTAGSASGTTYLDLATTTVNNLLSSVDAITGTGTPSTISGGVITLNDDVTGGISVSSSPAGTLAALGFSGAITGSATAAGSVVNTQASLPAPTPISGTTLLAGAAGTNSLTSSFSSGDTITINGKTIQFYSAPSTAGAAPNTTYLNLATTTVSNLLSSIDSITGTSTPSSVSGGVITLQSNSGAPLTVSSSNAGAFAALGFSGPGGVASVSATVPPLRVSGTPLGSATTLVSGTPANTVTWYTGGTSTGSARASQVAHVSSSASVDYGIQANEQGIRSQLQAIAVFAAFSASASNPNAQAQVAALSTSVGTALSSSPPGQQTMQDIQSDLANAQTILTSAGSLQTQTQNSLQNTISQIETVSPDQVATEILSLQTQLQASYQTTSMLSQLSLVKFLPTP